MMVMLPNDLCSPQGLGTIRKEIGQKEENFIHNVCRIKELSNEVLAKFKSVTDAEHKFPDSKPDVTEEVTYHNSRLSTIENLARITKVSQK